jgi:hypothetical protein
MHRCESSNFLTKKPLTMGIINKGILGPVSGTVGTVIGGSWKGIPYLRSQPTSTRTEFTQPQLNQQQRFATTVSFLQPMTALLTVSFRDFAVKMSGFNNAVSYTLKNAITGAYPTYTIDYSMALVSRGDLPNAIGPAATVSGTNQIGYSWTDNTGVGKATATDKSILVVYCPARKQCIFTTAGSVRSAGSATIDVAAFAGQTVQTYIGFVSADGKDIASSFFTGQFAL